MGFLKPLLISLTLCLSSTQLFAQSDLGKGLQFVAGAYAGLYIHEAGHALVAKSIGASDVEIVIPKPNAGIYSGETRSTFPNPIANEEKQILALSGLLAQNLATELILQNKLLHKSSLAQGVVSGSMVINVANVYRYYTKVIGVDGYRGNDIDHYAQSGGNPHVVSALLLTYTAYSLQRMRKNEMPLFGISLKF